MSPVLSRVVVPISFLALVLSASSCVSTTQSSLSMDPGAAPVIAEWGPAAEDGDPAAQFRVGLAYDTGEGAACDPREAATW